MPSSVAGRRAKSLNRITTYTVMAIGTVTFTGKAPPWSARQYCMSRLALFRCLFACDMTSRMGNRSSTVIGNSCASQHRAVTRRGFSSLPSRFFRARSAFHFCLAVRGGGGSRLESVGPTRSGAPLSRFSLEPGPALVGRVSGDGAVGFLRSTGVPPGASSSSSSSDSASWKSFTRLSTTISAAPSLNDARYSEKVPLTLYAPFRVTFRLAILPDAS